MQRQRRARGIHRRTGPRPGPRLAPGFPGFGEGQEKEEWRSGFYPALADKSVLVVGYGSIGAAIEDRLEPFECARVVRVARSARTTARGPVHAIDELPSLLPEADVVILSTPLNPSTQGLVGPRFLAAMKDGALLVNVARGGVVDTSALLAELESGRLRAALDVTDPEPLPAGHPLWHAPHTLITPMWAAAPPRSCPGPSVCWPDSSPGSPRARRSPTSCSRPADHAPELPGRTAYRQHPRW